MNPWRSCGESVYVWERDDWPDFVWDAAELLGPLTGASRRQGVLLGRMTQLGLDLSSQLRRDRKEYYLQLERAQKGPLDVTPWLLWFTEAFTQAVDSAEGVLGDVLGRAELGKRLATLGLNERQRLMMGKLLAGLEGKLTSGRWAAMTRCSPDTAQRDLKELLALKLLVKNPGGSKNTSYALRV